MELFMLLVDPLQLDAPLLTTELRCVMEELLHEDAVILRQVPLTGGTGIVCDLPPHRSMEKLVARSRTQVSQVLAGAMIRAYESPIILRFIRQELVDTNPTAREFVANRCSELLAEHPQQPRKVLLQSELEAYLHEQSFLHVAGFMQFRARAYLAELMQIITRAIEEWRREQQFQEFLSLLQAVIYSQDVKMRVLHVIYDQRGLIGLMNEHLQSIHYSPIQQEELISTLIYLAPEQLHIHSPDLDKQLFSTMATIFQGRVRMCTNCRVCQPFLDKISPNDYD
jgi:putative sporulation protein YtxC